jgi:hypothetical protein
MEGRSRYGCFRTQLEKADLGSDKPARQVALPAAVEGRSQEIDGRAGKHTHPFTPPALGGTVLRHG